MEVPNQGVSLSSQLKGKHRLSLTCACERRSSDDRSRRGKSPRNVSSETTAPEVYDTLFRRSYAARRKQHDPNQTGGDA